ncbi:DNA replication ATP-dependent helicase/nuclease JHS1 [Aristolochia californica]|uniref:DNA replication ATP-dependent helicase/nuclease JHS1 n=1 Tax=Aristolochia californica TaxID=171875 RepID=UPI0035E20324
MGPRKRASSSSKKSNHHQNSQPSKFGIQHFFERHSQSVAQASQPPEDVSNSLPGDSDKPVATTPLENLPKNAARLVTQVEEHASEVSPEITKAVSVKRFKFSPGMLIKQSQDDGGDEVTWKISPVNERLRSVTKQLPELMGMLSDASNRSVSSLRLCSQKKTPPSSEGRLQRVFTSPIVKVKMVSYQEVGTKMEAIFYDGPGSTGDSNIVSTANQQTPFMTPPSMLYCSDESADGSHKGDSNQLGSKLHRKALLELLDQVEDVITEDAAINSDESYVLTDQEKGRHHMSLEADHLKKVLKKIPAESSDCKSSLNFLVLEVTEKRGGADSANAQYPYKVLRLLNELTGEERLLHLHDQWFHSLIGSGDTVNVIGEFDEQGKCIVNHEKNLIIVHPDLLLSGTRVASSFACSRRAVLDERLRFNEHSNAALIGTLLHQLFQAALLKELPTQEFLEEYARMVIQKNIENLYASGVNEEEAYSALVDSIPKVLHWLVCYRNSKETKAGSTEFGLSGGQKNLCITEVIDIEEMAWAPRYGLKGIIDASVRVNITSDNEGSHEKIMPLEFKTGKGTSGQSAMEHSAQVILYTLLMSERYMKDVDSGLIYYLYTDQTRGIAVQRSDLVGLIMRRNELAIDILKATKLQLLPSMLRNPSMCKSCRHINACTVLHKAHGGNMETSGLGDLFNTYVEHLTSSHCDFLHQWDRLIDLEAKESQVTKKEIWDSSLKTEHRPGSLSYFVLDLSNKTILNGSTSTGRFIYRFVRQDLLIFDSKVQDENHAKAHSTPASDVDCLLKQGDYVILSTKSGRLAVAKGIVVDTSRFHVSVSFSRRLRLPGSNLSSEMGDLQQEVWLIDKDEVASSYAIMRFNLIALFMKNAQNSHLRKIIVDLEAPRFDSGVIFSQDPAISYVQSEKSLNEDQRRAVRKILAAKDYTLILGMPGTGKTSTMVHAVKALLIRGASILLTSYTNSAVDNLLIKLKAQGIDFVRLGREEAIHEEVRGYCFSAANTSRVEDIKQRMNQVKVVGVTCLGINHSLLANMKFDICIMDEAGQITLPVSLGPLAFASTFVLVGDHYQLPPLVKSAEARESGMGKSLFCRLSEAHPQAISALQCQYRMCSSIMELSNTLIYGNRLRCGSSEVADAKLKIMCSKPMASWLNEVLDPKRSVAFVNTDMLPALEVKQSKTINNPTEAHIVAEITRELVKGGITGDEIGIITPYNSQANLIRQVVDASVEIHTIDKYQGRDKDCIVVSFVRSSKNSRACSSTLLGDWQRINVAITRAKKKLILVGSCRTLSKVPLLKLLIEKVDEQLGMVHVSEKEINHLGDLRKCSQMR